MYNLLVSSDDESWNGEAYFLDISRCIREHTDTKLVKKFADMEKSSITKLLKYPCIFAYEKACKKDPKFGYIKSIVHRQGQARIEYEILNVNNFLSYNDLSELLFELDINKYELNRTHWALKDVNLEEELKNKDIYLPLMAQNKTIVDITCHQFDVALSFPGEVRDYVKLVADELENILGKNTYFYDNNYKAQLARPSLDVVLQNIYRKQSKLVVVFICKKYQDKDWCGLEFRAIREILMKRQHEKIMFIKMDNGKVEGVFDTDGYIDGRTHTAEEIAEFIKERITLIPKMEEN